jgi:hypothetical protein
MKVHYHQGAMALVVIVMLLYSVMLGCIIREIEYVNGHYYLKDMSNAFWLTIETILSIGYGELIPEADMGRIVMGFLAFMSLYVLAYLILVTNRNFALTSSERWCFNE